jgi:hypothetical protein
VTDVVPGRRPYPDLKWVAVDFDGTIAEPLWTPENPTGLAGPPLPGVREKLRELVEHGYKPIVHTSRGWTDYEYIEWYCDHYELPIRRIVCGKILAARYIDDLNGHVNDESWLP